MKIYSFLILFVVTLSSCAQNHSGEKGAASVVNISQEDFKKNYENVEGLQLLDVRTTREIAAGKIGEAKELDVFDPEFTEKIAGLNFDTEKPVFIYCKSGGRSTRAAQIFIEQGFTEVYNLSGGYSLY